MPTFYVPVCLECEAENCQDHERFRLRGVQTETRPDGMFDEQTVLADLSSSRKEALKYLKTDKALQSWIECFIFGS